jgi:hypothetical protein
VFPMDRGSTNYLELRPRGPPPPGPLPRCAGEGENSIALWQGWAGSGAGISRTWKKPRSYTGAAASHQTYFRTFVLSYPRTPYAICSWPMELSAVSSTGGSASATPWWASQRSASSAAMQPVPAAVMAWR